MDFYNREFFIYRIMCGYINITLKNKCYTIYSPDDQIRYEAQDIYKRVYEDALDRGLLTIDDICDTLIEVGLWSEKQENELEKILPNHIEYWKVELYKAYLKSNTKEKIRKYLEVAKKEFARLYNIKHGYDYATCEGLANFSKSQYIIGNTTYFCREKVDWDTCDINQVMNEYHKNILGGDTIRLLARTTPWTNFWHCYRKSNTKLFTNDRLTDEQIILISWSNSYDNIHESPECPPDEILDDDDALDGWILVQKKKREAEKAKAEIESHISGNKKILNASEIYIPVETETDAAKIDSLNSESSRMIKRNRFKQIQRQGVVAEQDLWDVKQNLFARGNRIQ